MFMTMCVSALLGHPRTVPGDPWMFTTMNNVCWLVWEVPGQSMAILDITRLSLHSHAIHMPHISVGDSLEVAYVGESTVSLHCEHVAEHQLPKVQQAA